MKIVVRTIKQALSENSYCGMTKYVAGWVWNMVHLSRKHEELLSSKPVEWTPKGKNDRMRRNRKAE